MSNYKKYLPVIVFCILVVLLIMGVAGFISPKLAEISDMENTVASQEQELKNLSDQEAIVQKKIKQMQDSIMNSPKKLYTPVESDLGNDTLFFTLYNDLIEMLHANSIKIQTIDYKYNPESDAFVKAGKDLYFVCDVNMDLISNYVNLGKLVQDIYQYPYYMKINSLEVKPYPKDKKVLFSHLSLRLYAPTSPDNNLLMDSETNSAAPINGAKLPLPQ